MFRTSRSSRDVRLESAKWAKMAIRSSSLSVYGHPRAAVPQYGRRYHHEGTIMKKLSMIGIVGGAALLAAVPLSLQWSQVGSAVPLLTVSHANAQYYGPSRRHVRRVDRRAYRRAYGGYPPSYGGYPSPYPSPAPTSYGGYPSCLGQYPC
jgi:hypothetical protein